MNRTALLDRSLAAFITLAAIGLGGCDYEITNVVDTAKGSIAYAESGTPAFTTTEFTATTIDQTTVDVTFQVDGDLCGIPIDVRFDRPTDPGNYDLSELDG